jgi:hypothetical protein
LQEKPKYSGGVDVVRQLYKEGGVRSVFRGSAMTLARDGPGSAAYFATYEYLKRSLSPKDAEGNATGELSISAVMAAGGAAGIAMWIPVFPVDTVKSRLQSMEGSPTIRVHLHGEVFYVAWTYTQSTVHRREEDNRDILRFGRSAVVDTRLWVSCAEVQEHTGVYVCCDGFCVQTATFDVDVMHVAVVSISTDHPPCQFLDT